MSEPHHNLSPASVTLPEWEDTRVQIVYNMLCDDALNTPPNPEEHWEGWVSRNIVAALCGPVAQPPVDSTALLANCDKLHDLGFEGGWNAAVEGCAKIAETAYSLMFPKPANRITAENAGHAAAAAIRALAMTSTPRGGPDADRI